MQLVHITRAHCKCWELETENISSIERLGYTLKLRINRPIAHLPISVYGLLFIRTFLLHNGYYFSGNGRQLFGNKPQEISVILHFSPFSSNERLENLLLVHWTGKIRCLQLQCVCEQAEKLDVLDHALSVTSMSASIGQ